MCQNTIAQDYIRTVNYDRDDICFVASTSCKDGELRMASTTNIKSKEANIALSNLGIKSDYGNGIVFRIPQEQKNNSRGANNETDTSRTVYNSKTGLYERKASDYVVYIQDTNDIDLEQDPRFKTAQFVASQTGWPILIIPREKYAQSEIAKIQELKDKLLGNKERSQGETDEETLIRECKEELTIDIKKETIKYYGTFEAQAHGKTEGVLVKMTCYLAEFDGELEASSEIQEITWLTYKDLDKISPVDKLIFKDLYEKELII